MSTFFIVQFHTLYGQVGTYGEYETKEQAIRGARKASKDERVNRAEVLEQCTSSPTPQVSTSHGSWYRGRKIQ